MNCSEKYDDLKKEMEFCELIDFLLIEQRRLQRLLIETRQEVNIFSKPGLEPYPLAAENLFNCQLDDHPAMLKYYELYGNDTYWGDF
jgi:hypothetical protein